MHHVGHHVHVVLEVVTGAERETGGDQAFLQAGAFAHADAAVVHEGTTAFGGGEQVVAARVVNDGLFNLALHGQRNTHAVHREAMDEVGGAVQRVDDPDVVGVLCTLGAAGFFGEDAMSWVGGEQRLDDHFLSRVVHFGDEVVDLLLRNPHRFHVERGAVDDGASGACGLDGHVDHGVQIGGHGL